MVILKYKEPLIHIATTHLPAITHKRLKATAELPPNYNWKVC